MKKKVKLMSRDQICEWFNPVLTGETQGNPFSTGCENPTFVAPNSNNNPFVDFLENPPEWLNPNCADDTTTVGQGGGGKETFGAMLINGMPLSPWGAMYVGNTTYQRQNIMNNFIDVTNRIQSFMSTINTQSFTEDDVLGIKVTNIIIQKIVPAEAGIGVNVFVSFDYDGVNFFGNIYKFGVKDKTGNVLICQPLKEMLPEEGWIKLSGKLKLAIEKWLKPASGIYQCIAKEVIVYNSFGQLNRLKLGDKIEVIKADSEKIQFNWNEAKWFIKTPTYWWFNYYFDKIK